MITEEIPKTIISVDARPTQELIYARISIDIAKADTVLMLKQMRVIYVNLMLVAATDLENTCLLFAIDDICNSVKMSRMAYARVELSLGLVAILIDKRIVHVHKIYHAQCTPSLYISRSCKRPSRASEFEPTTRVWLSFVPLHSALCCESKGDHPWLSMVVIRGREGRRAHDQPYA
jgi:hypothetical protein